MRNACDDFLIMAIKHQDCCKDGTVERVFHKITLKESRGMKFKSWPNQS